MNRNIITLIALSLMLCSCYQEHCSQNNLAEIRIDSRDPSLSKGSNHSGVAQAVQNLLFDIESSAYMIKLTEHRDVQYLATITFRDMLWMKKELMAFAKANRLAVPQTLTSEQKQLLAKLENLQEEEQNYQYAALINKQYDKTMSSLTALSTDGNAALANYAGKKVQQLQGHRAEAKYVLHIMQVIRGDKGERPLEISQEQSTVTQM